MPIRPIDVRRKEFKSTFRGYDANQVEDFLDAVADEFERNYTENQRMREEVSSLRDRLQQFEDLEGSIRDALVHAEQASNDLRRAASREAEGIKQSAQREADFTIREAQSRSHQMLADSSARLERVQDSYDALQESKRSFANDFRHLLKTYTDVIENMEVASAREIETSLRERLESIAVVREAAQEEARSAEEAMVTAEAMTAAGMVPEPPDAQDTPSGLEVLEPAEEDAEVQEIGSAADEQPKAVIRAEGSEPETEVPISEDPEVAEPEVEPSTVKEEADQTEVVQAPTVTEAASEVEREEPSLAEVSRSQQFFDKDGEHSDSRIFRASRFLRRRE